MDWIEAVLLVAVCRRNFSVHCALPLRRSQLYTLHTCSRRHPKRRRRRRTLCRNAHRLAYRFLQNELPTRIHAERLPVRSAAITSVAEVGRLPSIATGGSRPKRDVADRQMVWSKGTSHRAIWLMYINPKACGYPNLDHFFVRAAMLSGITCDVGPRWTSILAAPPIGQDKELECSRVICGHSEFRIDAGIQFNLPAADRA
jgi:hypothetical protein